MFKIGDVIKDKPGPACEPNWLGRIVYISEQKLITILWTRLDDNITLTHYYSEMHVNINYELVNQHKLRRKI